MFWFYDEIINWEVRILMKKMIEKDYDDYYETFFLSKKFSRVGTLNLCLQNTWNKYKDTFLL